MLMRPLQLLLAVLAVMGVCGDDANNANDGRLQPTNNPNPMNKYRGPPFTGEQGQPYPGLEANMTYKPDDGRYSYQGHGRLKGKIAIITGGDSGIGRATAVAFAKEGVSGLTVAYLAAEQVDADETKRLVELEGARCVLVTGDLEDPATAEHIVQATVDAFGRVDILVNNAAVQQGGVFALSQLTHERVRRTFLVNVVAMFDLVRLAAPYMKPGSSVINTASVQAYQPDFLLADYATSKGAIVTFTKALARKLIQSGIRVNCVAPGPVWTPFVIQNNVEPSIRVYGTSFDMKRPAQPAEIAPAFVFLASDEASFVNGEILGVTGQDGI